MKALDEYFLMVVFTLLLNRVHVFANFMSNLNRETWHPKGKTRLQQKQSLCLLWIVHLGNNGLHLRHKFSVTLRLLLDVLLQFFQKCVDALQ